MLIELAGQFRQQTGARPFSVERNLDRAREKIAGLMRIGNGHRQSRGLQRASRLDFGAAGRLQHDARRSQSGDCIGHRLDAERLVPVAEDHPQRRDADLNRLVRHADADKHALGRQRLAVLLRCSIAHTNSLLISPFSPAGKKLGHRCSSLELSQSKCNISDGTGSIRFASSSRGDCAIDPPNTPRRR
ncbi:hypothetical protein [Burkholderia sp. IT-111MI5]|uniref:hypothetical protein n=1 Tax=Burkholderia sp. IT-111MI5 TaxID=3026439 RepID=UPI0039E07E96